MKDYQNKVEDTWISNEHDLSRILCGISGETGEVAERFKKYFRGDYNVFKLRDDCKKEIGDVYYYLAKLCNYLAIDCEEILKMNIDKLADRKDSNNIKGEGSER